MRGSPDSIWYPLGLSFPDPLVLNRVSISALELPMLTLPLDLCLNPFPDGPSTPSPFPWQVLVIFEDLTLIPNIFALELPKWC